MDSHENTSRCKRPWWAVFAAMLSLAALAAHAWSYLPFISDDALISLRYAQRLLQGKGLTWTEGQPVEGYSNLLWTLMVALLGWLGIDLIDAARILGLLGMGSVVVIAVWWYTSRYESPEKWPSLAFGLFFYCGAAPIAVWTVGGLEQPFCAAFVAATIPLVFTIIESDPSKSRTILGLSFVLGLLCITRPDGPLFSVAGWLSIVVGRSLLKRSWPLRNTFLLALFPVSLYGGQLCFRYSYYGEFVPNTALVKIAPSLNRLWAGISYVFQEMLALTPFSLFAAACLIGLVASRPTRHRGLALLIPTVLWLFYIILVGGDIFPSGRHLVVIIVFFLFAVIEYGPVVRRYLKQQSRRKRWACHIGLLASCIMFLLIQVDPVSRDRADQERWEWDGQVLGLLLKKAFAEKQPLVAVTAAGCIPYWSELPSLDMLGLNDYYLPRHPPANMGAGYLGHELGDGVYVMQQKPDMIIFNTGSLWPLFRSAVQLVAMPEFKENYVPVSCEGSNPHAYRGIVWMNKNSPKIGIRKTPHEITIPAYLFTENPQTAAHLNQRNELVISVSSGCPAAFRLTSDLLMIHSQVKIRGVNADSIRAERKKVDRTTLLQLTSDSKTPVEIKEIVFQDATNSSQP